MTTLKIFNNHLKAAFLSLAAIEFWIFFGALIFAAQIRFNTQGIADTLQQFDDLPMKASVFAVFHMLGMIALGQYQREQYRGNKSFLQMLSRVLVSMLLVSVTLSVLYYLLPSVEVGRGMHGLAFAIALLGIVVVKRIFFHLVDRRLFDTNVLILGTGHRALSMYRLSTDPNTRISCDIRGFIALATEDRLVPAAMVTELGESLLSIARRMEVNEIVLALDDRRKGYPTQQLIECKMAGIHVIDPVTFLEREQGKVNLKLMNPSWLIYSDGFGMSRLHYVTTRAFDVAVSALILLLTAPVLLITAILIGLESGFREPIFYKQVRVGMNGKHFNLLKFRSMKVGAECNGAVWADKGDSRVTRVGRVIRKFRIDELPQILNIFKGDMRLVGPRPERPEFVMQLSQSIEMYSRRHVVKPGLAGWAQLRYPYGASEEDAFEKLQYDLFYIKNSNLVMDFFILLQTLEVVLFGKGAR